MRKYDIGSEVFTDKIMCSREQFNVGKIFPFSYWFCKCKDCINI